jgi:hypothetical protein
MEPEKLTTGSGTGERKNQGKLRYDLVPDFAQQEYVRVLTKGAEKYSPDNWRGGMKWSTVLASLSRHLAELKKGKDFDDGVDGTGCYHAAQIMCNAAFILEYYRIHPQGDDRKHSYLKPLKIGLDLDEVLVGFVNGYMKKFSIDKTPETWNFDPQLPSRLKDLPNEWWLALEPLIDPSELTFEPTCYITSRIIDSSVSAEWIHKNNFPSAPVFTVKSPEEKVAVALENKLDLFADDSYSVFQAMNRAGVCCFLVDAPHNRRYDVGFKRIKSLSELTKF